MYEKQVLGKFEPWSDMLYGKMSDIEKIASTACTSCGNSGCGTIGCTSCGGSYKSSAPSYKPKYSSKTLKLSDVI